MEDQTTMGSPVITLPDDAERLEQLRRKLAEYKARLENPRPPSRDDAYKPPEVMQAKIMVRVLKVEVLERLLADGSINTHDLSLELANRYGDKFSISAFDLVCGVIDDYCKTGGANCSGGTGLN